MKNLSIKAVSKLTLVALFAIGLSSCATSNLDEVKAMAQQAQQTAAQLQDQVKKAQDDASQALSTANDASQKADEALKNAGDAKACCDANTERMDRMFKKLQQK